MDGSSNPLHGMRMPTPCMPVGSRLSSPLQTDHGGMDLPSGCKATIVRSRQSVQCYWYHVRYSGADAPQDVLIAQNSCDHAAVPLQLCDGLDCRLHISFQFCLLAPRAPLL